MMIFNQMSGFDAQLGEQWSNLTQFSEQTIFLLQE